MYLVGSGIAIAKSMEKNGWENSGGETYLGVNATTAAKSMKKNH